MLYGSWVAEPCVAVAWPAQMMRDTGFLRLLDEWLKPTAEDWIRALIDSDLRIDLERRTVLFQFEEQRELR